MINLPELGEPLVTRFLTLTSSAETGGGSDRLAARGLGGWEPWELLDERYGADYSGGVGRRVPSRSPRHAGCTHHRLVISSSQGPLRLAEIELLS